MSCGWFGTGGNPADALPEGFNRQRLEYELTQIAPLVFFVLVGFGFYAAGRRTREEAATG